MYNPYGKRILDVVIALTGLILTLPVILLIALLVRIFIGTPVLFCQERPGYLGQMFTLCKFRTMTNERDVNGNLLPDTQRLTEFGKFLRKTSLDELPELINVIKGDMSLVGPRPLLERYYPYFTEEEKIRFTMKPGITGLAQVLGRNDLSWDKRIAADIKYIHQCSLSVDMKVLVSTGWSVISSRGLQVDPGSVMLDFDEERRIRFSKSSE